MKKQSHTYTSVLTFLVVGFISFGGSLKAQHTGGIINPTKLSEQTIENRKAIRYEHTALAEWGYTDDVKDYFHLVPAKSKNAPLRVILHSVGHTGDKVLDPAAYLIGHGFKNTRALRGGIDVYAQEADGSVPRYKLEFE